MCVGCKIGIVQAPVYKVNCTECKIGSVNDYLHVPFTLYTFDHFNIVQDLMSKWSSGVGMCPNGVVIVFLTLFSAHTSQFLS